MSRKPTQATFGNIVVLMAVLLVQGLRLQAQQATAALNGTMKDSAGSIVPEVQLTLANVATGIERKTLSNATGNYVKVVQRIPVKIVFEPGHLKGHELRPGMSVEPKVWIRN